MKLGFNIASLPLSWRRLMDEFRPSISKVTEILLIAWELKQNDVDEADVLTYLTDRFLEDVIEDANHDQEAQLAHLAGTVALLAINQTGNCYVLDKGIAPLVGDTGSVIESAKVGLYGTVVVEISARAMPRPRHVDSLPTERIDSLKRLAKLKDTLDAILNGRNDCTSEALLEELSGAGKSIKPRQGDNTPSQKTPGKHRNPRRRRTRDSD